MMVGAHCVPLASPHESSARAPSSTQDSTLLLQTFSAQNAKPPDSYNYGPLGIPKKKSIISWRDIGVLVLCLACFTAAVVSVFLRSVTVSLGQVNQLIVLGFLLSLMSLCSERQVLFAALLYEARAGQSTLQNFDALLRKDLFASQVNVIIRIILLLIAVPLALSVGYKNFVGGISFIDVQGLGGKFGVDPPPDYQDFSIGYTILANFYYPFWRDPQFLRTYGFNLLVESNTTSAALDGPTPQYISAVRSTLTSGQSVQVTTRVNATVPEYKP